MLHELGSSLVLFALHHVLPRFVHLVFLPVSDAIVRYGRHHKKPVVRDAKMIICRQ